MKTSTAIICIVITIGLLMLVRDNFPKFPVLGLGVGIGYVIGKFTKRED